MGNRIGIKGWTTLLSLLSLAGCVRHDHRPFPLADPYWEDSDRNHLAEAPGKYWSGINADGADKLLFYPLAEAFYFHSPGEAVNVNAIDEVPNSSWFTNRIGLFDISPERAARAACGDTPTIDPNKGPWVVTGAKPNGANPGFFIKAQDGFTYLLKFDGLVQPGRATAADVVGSKLYWATGFPTPCNEVVYFRPDILEIAPDAESENELGDDVPMETKHLDQVLAKAMRTKDGMLRASASRFVPGKPIGPFKYQSTRGDDPNDVINHEDRRELRGAYLLAAWINHIDAREQNTFDVLVEEEGRTYIRHFKIDWGDAFGIDFEPERMMQTFGHTYSMDWEHMFVDFVSFGLKDRPWRHAVPAEINTFGYYDVDSFDPENWRGVYEIPAFARRTPSDILWMVRILSRITDAHLDAMVKEAKLPDPRQSAYLLKTLIGRRDKILSTFLNQYAPLAHFYLARRDPASKVQSLCFEDLALRHGFTDRDQTYYKMRFVGGDKGDELMGWLQFMPDEEHPHYSCVTMPAGHIRPSQLVPDDAPPDHRMRYGQLQIFIHQRSERRPMSSVNLHMYDLGPEQGFRLVGVERLTADKARDLAGVELVLRKYR